MERAVLSSNFVSISVTDLLVWLIEKDMLVVLKPISDKSLTKRYLAST